MSHNFLLRFHFRFSKRALSVSICILVAALISACTIVQTIEPAEIDSNAKICIVENPTVREGFLQELKKVLGELNIDYIVTDNSGARDCKWELSYVARWSWEYALYLSYAEISVFKHGSLDGRAYYDSTGGYERLDKFIDAEPKIRELVLALIQVVSTTEAAESSSEKEYIPPSPVNSNKSVTDIASQLQTLHDLKERGIITQEEYDRLKSDIIDFETKAEP